MSALVVTFLSIGGLALLLLILALLGGGHLHLGHFHVGHLHVGQVHMGHLHAGHLHVGQLHVGQLHVGQLHVGQLHVGQLHVGQPSPGPGGAGHGGTELSLPVLAGFLGAFGFGGAIAASSLPAKGAAAVLAAVVVGLFAAVPTAWLAGRLVNAAINIPTDGTLTSNDLPGASGVVITPVPVGGYGEVRLGIAGQQMKFNARSDEALPIGTRVFVIAVLSPTSVLVEATPAVP